MRLPKVMVSTMASTPKASSYVGTSDIVMVNTVTDLIGMNSILRGVLVNAVGAVCGMVEIDDEVCVTGSAGHRPTVAISAFGVTTQAARELSKTHALMARTEKGMNSPEFVVIGRATSVATDDGGFAPTQRSA